MAIKRHGTSITHPVNDHRLSGPGHHSTPHYHSPPLYDPTVDVPEHCMGGSYKEGFIYEGGQISGVMNPTILGATGSTRLRKGGTKQRDGGRLSWAFCSWRRWMAPRSCRDSAAGTIPWSRPRTKPPPLWDTTEPPAARQQDPSRRGGNPDPRATFGHPPSFQFQPPTHPHTHTRMRARTHTPLSPRNATFIYNNTNDGNIYARRKKGTTHFPPFPSRVRQRCHATNSPKLLIAQR